jgi:hypothetical protein
MQVKQKFGEMDNVLLTTEDYEKLIEKFGAQGATSWIEELSLAKASKGYKTKSDYATILTWERRKRSNDGAHRGSSKGTKLPAKYTEPPYDPEFEAFAEADGRISEES